MGFEVCRVSGGVALLYSFAEGLWVFVEVGASFAGVPSWRYFSEGRGFKRVVLMAFISRGRRV